MSRHSLLKTLLVQVAAHSLSTPDGLPTVSPPSATAFARSFPGLFPAHASSQPHAAVCLCVPPSLLHKKSHPPPKADHPHTFFYPHHSLWFSPPLLPSCRTAPIGPSPCCCVMAAAACTVPHAASRFSARPFTATKLVLLPLAFCWCQSCCDIRWCRRAARSPSGTGRGSRRALAATPSRPAASRPAICGADRRMSGPTRQKEAAELTTALTGATRRQPLPIWAAARGKLPSREQFKTDGRGDLVQVMSFDGQ